MITNLKPFVSFKMYLIKWPWFDYRWQHLTSNSLLTRIHSFVIECSRIWEYIVEAERWAKNTSCLNTISTKEGAVKEWKYSKVASFAVIALLVQKMDNYRSWNIIFKSIFFSVTLPCFMRNIYSSSCTLHCR